MYITAHLKVLRQIIHEVELREFIKYHKEVLILLTKFKKIFKPVIFVHYLFISMFLVVIASHIVIIVEIELRIVAIQSVTIAIITLLIFSYGGQMIMQSSTSICQELYKIDREYLIVIMRTQKPLSLKVGFFEPSLSSCRTYLELTFSLVVLLKHLTKL